MMNKCCPLLMASAISWLASLGLSAEAAASTWSADVVPPSCVSQQHPELARLRDEIAAAGSLTAARTLALAPTAAAIDALRNARSLMPFSEDLRSAEVRLVDARARIDGAGTPHQVADEFSGMMLAGLDEDRAARVQMGKVGCDYSTGELIAIVVGLILGIIPGLILLIVLC